MITDKEILKKQIIYRSSHRGSKEMDLLLGAFVNNIINKLKDEELKDLEEILMIEDEILYNWYFNKRENKEIPKNKITELLKNFKI